MSSSRGDQPRLASATDPSRPPRTGDDAVGRPASSGRVPHLRSRASRRHHARLVPERPNRSTITPQRRIALRAAYAYTRRRPRTRGAALVHVHGGGVLDDWRCAANRHTCSARRARPYGARGRARPRRADAKSSAVLGESRTHQTDEDPDRLVRFSGRIDHPPIAIAASMTSGGPLGTGGRHDWGLLAIRSRPLVKRDGDPRRAATADQRTDGAPRRARRRDRAQAVTASMIAARGTRGHRARACPEIRVVRLAGNARRGRSATAAHPPARALVITPFRCSRRS